MFKHLRHIVFVIYILLCSLSLSAQDSLSNKFMIRGGMQLKRALNQTRYYPDIGFLYRSSYISSFEIGLAYHHEKLLQDSFSFIPISFGYRFDIIPIFLRHRQLFNKVKLYNGIKYVLRYEYSSDTDYNKINNGINFSVGFEYYVCEHWGINVEKILGVTDKYYNMWSCNIIYSF